VIVYGRYFRDFLTKQQLDELEIKLRRHRPTIRSCTPSFFEMFKRVREHCLSLEDPQLPWPPFFLASSPEGESIFTSLDRIPIIVLDEEQHSTPVSFLLHDAARKRILHAYIHTMYVAAKTLALEGAKEKAARVADRAHTLLKEHAAAKDWPTGPSPMPREGLLDIIAAFLMGHELGHYMVRRGHPWTRAAIPYIRKRLRQRLKDEPHLRSQSHMMFRFSEMGRADGFKASDEGIENLFDDIAEEIVCDSAGLLYAIDLDYVLAVRRVNLEGKAQGPVWPRNAVIAIFEFICNFQVVEFVKTISRALATSGTNSVIRIPVTSMDLRTILFPEAMRLLTNRSRWRWPGLDWNENIVKASVPEVLANAGKLERGNIEKMSILRAAVIHGLGMWHAPEKSPALSTLVKLDSDQWLDRNSTRELGDPFFSPSLAGTVKALSDVCRAATGEITGYRGLSSYHRAIRHMNSWKMAELVYQLLLDLDDGPVTYPFDPSAVLH